MTIKSKIESILDRIKPEEITHTIVTKTGHEIKCYSSIQLYEGEVKIIVAKCRIGLKDRLITILDDNIEYISESYNDEAWDSLINIQPVNEDNVKENRLYG